MTSPWKRDSYKVLLPNPTVTLGGSFGQVYKAREVLTSYEYAIKKIGVTSFRRNILDVLKSNAGNTNASSSQENYCLKNVLQVLLSEINNKSLDNTTFIVKCETCWFEGTHEQIFNKLGEYAETELPEINLESGGSSGAPMDEDFLFIPMEWCDLDLSKWLDGHSVEEGDIQELYGFWGNILQGLAELQRRQIIHRDIKPQNILIKQSSENGRFIAKIGDFGLSTSLRGSKNIWQTVKVGTWRYMSPEMRRGNGDYDYKTDVFSAGLTFAECVLRLLKKQEIMKEPEKKVIEFRDIDTYLDELRLGMEPDFLKERTEKELILEMCQIDVENRGYAMDCLEVLNEIYPGNSSLEFTAIGESKRKKKGKVGNQLQPQEIEFLTNLETGMFSNEGRFEGLNVDDEQIANYLTENYSNKKNLLSYEWKSPIEKEEFIDRVRLTAFALNERTLWWNSKVPSRLPPNFIERRLSIVETRGSAQDKKNFTLSEIVDINDPFVWLVDSPGMGKSTVTTKLEDLWRKSVPSWRLVVRLNLNLVQEAAASFDDHDDKDEEEGNSSKKKSLNFIQRFITKFAPHIPIDSLKNQNASTEDPSIKVIVLLDGLDEVGTQNEQKMLQILQTLLIVSPKESTDKQFLSLVLRQPQFENDSLKLKLQKVFLTTRPHLKRLVQNKLKVNPFTLLPLDSEQRIQFLAKEVSTSAASFSEDQAKNAILSLSPFARQLMGNPMLLFLFAQIIKANGPNNDNTKIDIYDLYERFMEAKHWLYAVEKEVADPNQQSTAIHVRNTLEASDPFYFSCALNELKPSFGEVWPPPGDLPEGHKLNELLSIGLIIVNRYGQPAFAHKSFAEFFLVRMMISPSTPDFIRDSIFAEIHGKASVSFSNVVDFLLCILEKRQRIADSESKSRLLPISKGWLQVRFKEEVLRRFLKGKLFPILGNEIFSFAIDFSDSEIIETLASFQDDKIPWPRLLNLKDPKWLRTRVFNIPEEQPQSESEGVTWSKPMAGFVTAIFCFEPWALERQGLLSKAELVSAFSLCGNIVGIATLHAANFTQITKIVLGRLGRQSLKETMCTKESLDSTLKSRKGAWWVAEILKRDELRSVLTDQATRVIDIIGEHPRIVDQVWGEEFLGDLISFQYKFMDNKIGQSALLCGRADEVEYMLDKVWERLITDREDALASLRESFMLNPKWEFLRSLEEQIDKRCYTQMDCVNVIERVVKWSDQDDMCSSTTWLWDHFNEVDFYFLPYVVRYGKLNHVKKLFPCLLFPSENHLRTDWAEKISIALLLSLIVDESDETFEYLRMLCEGVETPEDHYYPLLFSSFFEVETDDIREQLALCSFSSFKGQPPLVCQVSWGEILLRLSPNFPVILNELPSHLGSSAFKNFFHWSTCGDLSLVQNLLVSPSKFYGYKKTFLEEASGAAAGRSRRPYDFPHQRRIFSLLQFIIQLDGTDLTWLPEIHQIHRLSEILVNFHLSSEVLSEEERVENSDLIITIQSKLRSLMDGKTNVEGLLAEIPPFRTEREWSVVLQGLQIISPELDSDDQTSNVTYGDPVTPLLRVWLKHVGEEETLRVAEKEALPFYIKYAELYGWNLPARLFIGGEALLLAVELGSLRLLEELTWPSHFRWGNSDGKTLLEISREKWGQGHPVSTFLRRKSKLTFCCDNS